MLSGLQEHTASSNPFFHASFFIPPILLHRAAPDPFTTQCTNICTDIGDCPNPGTGHCTWPCLNFVRFTLAHSLGLETLTGGCGWHLFPQAFQLSAWCHQQTYRGPATLQAEGPQRKPQPVIDSFLKVLCLEFVSFPDTMKKKIIRK